MDCLWNVTSSMNRCRNNVVCRGVNKNEILCVYNHWNQMFPEMCISSEIVIGAPSTMSRTFPRSSWGLIWLTSLEQSSLCTYSMVLSEVRRMCANLLCWSTPQWFSMCNINGYLDGKGSQAKLIDYHTNKVNVCKYSHRSSVLYNDFNIIRPTTFKPPISLILKLFDRILDIIR